MGWKKDIRPGYRSKEIQCGACTIIIHRPELTDAERHEREEIIKRSLGAAYRERRKVESI